MYALLSGLNAATVGIIFLAAVQLSQKAITDKVTRVLVFVGGAAGVLYNALWYFPVLMVVGGSVTAIWDGPWSHTLVAHVQKVWRRRGQHGERDTERQDEHEVAMHDRCYVPEHDGPPNRAGHGIQDSMNAEGEVGRINPAGRAEQTNETNANDTTTSDKIAGGFSIVTGFAVAAGFFAFFITLMILRGTLHSPPRWFKIFANMILAGMSSHLH